MLQDYLLFVQQSPFQSAAIQFGVLGTLGELLAFAVLNKQLSLPCNPKQLIMKVAAWASLGLFIKFGFIGMKGFTYGVLEHQLLPYWLTTELGLAFSISIFTNLFFGPQLMFLHRFEDNLIMGEKGYFGIDTALWTLVWFWIPAHTLTFTLDLEYQIVMAAFWGIILGFVLGLSKRAKEITNG
ncbi:MAG: hypothetical protein KUG78_05840 [Kangiellaceae bacterium]|nr:hypothetical protein [Kangiellaceae bacterium]